MILYELILKKRKWITKICSGGKEKGVARNRNSLIFNALQDGLEPEYMKSNEIFRNYKKLNISKL